MTNKLISLVLLTFFLATNYSYAEDQFLFPEKKPSVFKKNIKSETFKNLPQKKKGDFFKKKFENLNRMVSLIFHIFEKFQSNLASLQEYFKWMKLENDAQQYCGERNTWVENFSSY